VKATNYLARKVVDRNAFTLDRGISFANNSYAAFRVWDRISAYAEETMKHRVERTSEPVYEFVDQCRQLVGEPTAERITQDFASFKFQIENLNDLEKNERLKPWVAKERRFAIRERAKFDVYNRVANHRITQCKLARVVAVYRRAQFGHKTEGPDLDEERIRRETGCELNELWSEIIAKHRAVL
jgi:hypothetical protein